MVRRFEGLKRLVFLAKIDFALYPDCCLEILVVNGCRIIDDVIDVVVVIAELEVAHLWVKVFF